MGSTDKTIRLILAAIIAVLFSLGYISGTFGIVLLVVSVIFAAISFLSFCPIYKVFGINSCKVK